nr:RecName: Full=Pregnancy-associated glycoprotein 56D; Short=FdPAG56D [Dama dama]
SLRKMHALGET